MLSEHYAVPHNFNSRKQNKKHVFFVFSYSEDLDSTDVLYFLTLRERLKRLSRFQSISIACSTQKTFTSSIDFFSKLINF